ncbi:MAG: acyl-CoA thioesterase/BAAT N-terminal domain-containing protein [Actinomycetota bacterium]|nr:acyl-CoA thioesterase/BAAT N-terminal domain-containing protein [Actinomycetota bacterium]MDQ2957393.1 acyl-CoA thioesterase/BAAT N-terminal domain-containing protein [Actinomycetota bacterium]
MGQRGPSTSRRWLAAAVLALLAIGISGCQHNSHPAIHASMSVSVQRALFDTPVSVSVAGLPAGVLTTLTATAADRAGGTWTSSAQFRSTSAGTVSTSQASLAGSYAGTDPMGLFDLMVPPPGDKATAFEPPGAYYDDAVRTAGGYDVTLRASVAGRTVATATANRQLPGSLGITEHDLRPVGSGIYGDLYLPAATPGPRGTAARRPGVLIFGGSEGGISVATNAALYAAHGYPTLALAYFKEPGLPSQLANIPLEYFVKALAVLRSQPGVDPSHVVVQGASRGGELALLLAASYPKLVNAVIAGVPSSVVNMGYPDSKLPAWTQHGKPVPEEGIPVERIGGPIMLLCGQQDVVWDSCLFTKSVTTELTSNHFRYPVTVRNYPDGGHAVGEPAVYASVAKDAFDGFGGGLQANQVDRADGYARILTFLASH